MATVSWAGARNRAANLWPYVQGSAAATVAWLIAEQLPHNHEPFFAPIAAFVALNAPLGERGLNAIRLILGVIVGIVAAELTLLVVPGGRTVRLAVAMVVATAVARALGSSRMVVAQAASAAILTAAIADEAGATRLFDALVGAGVALVFSQFLFAPEPVGLLRRAQKSALGELSRGLALVAESLERGDQDCGDRAIDRLRDMRDGLSELSRVRRASRHVVRRSPVWRRQRAPVVRESENAGHLDLLAGSCLMLARVATDLGDEERRWLTPGVRELAGAVDGLVADLGDRQARQAAADRALLLARRLAREEPPSDGPALAQAIAEARIAAVDLMSFAGVDPDDAAAAVANGTGELEVPGPPSSAARLALRLGDLRGRVAGALSRRTRARDGRRRREAP